MTKLSICTVFLLLPSLLFAETTSGLYSSGPVLTCHAQGDIEGGYDTVDGEIVVQPDQELEQHPPIFASQFAPAQVGISFGFFACRMAPKTPMALTGTVTHPPMEFQGKITTQQKWPVEQPAQRGDHTDEEVCSFVGYQLEDAFELVLGDWVFPYGTKINCYSQKPLNSLNAPIFQLTAKQYDRGATSLSNK